MRKGLGNGAGIMSLIVSAAAAGLLFVLAAVGVVLAVVFVLVFLGVALVVTRKKPLGSHFFLYRKRGAGARQPVGAEMGEYEACYDLNPADYTSRPAGRALRSGDPR